MKKVLKAAVIGIATVGLLGAAACGGRHCSKDPEKMERMISSRLDDALDDIDATPAQRTQITAIKDRLVAQSRTLRTEHKAVRKEVFAQLTSDRPDAAKLHGIVDQRGPAFQAFAHQFVDAAVEIHGILTPEQRSKVQKKVQRHMDVE